ncbi:MAG TPA: DUF6193 family natural product biosynthesis protein [Blastocatellia bacterium]|nr:DUF6193 family natural product biosynthesis protein [Blastocatellia bacterium]
MSYREVSKRMDKDLYPDLAEAGGLHLALEQELRKQKSQLAVDTVEHFIPYAHVRQDARSSQVFIIAYERLFLFYFWNQGVSYGSGTCTLLWQVAQAIRYWIEEKPTIAGMAERYDWFQPNEQAKAHEAGELVDLQWRRLLDSWKNDKWELAASVAELIEVASHHPELRQLYPFTSLTRVCFSRTTGYPFADDCPHAEPVRPGWFRAYSAKCRIEVKSREGHEWKEAVYDVLGEGTAEEVIDLLIANLPIDCGPAFNGTADDLAGAAKDANQAGE